MRRAILVALLVAVTGSRVAAQEVTLRASTTGLTMDGDLTLEVRATGDFDEIVAPPTPGFTVVQQIQTGGGFQMEIIMNGRRVLTNSGDRTLQYVLQPTEPGQHVIGPVRLTTRGRVVAESGTVTVDVRVVDRAPVSARTAADIEKHADTPFFLVPMLPDRPIYVGEPFLLAFNLFIRRDVDARSATWAKAPDLSGFSAEEIPVSGRALRENRRVGRSEYVVIPRSLHLVVPLREGKVRVGESKIELLTGFPRRHYKVLGAAFDVEVRPVPREGRPAAFREGNLGRFDLAVEVRPAAVRAGERVILTARVSGNGSLETVRAPELPPIAGAKVEVLPSEDADQVEKGPDGISGTRVFQWVVLPSQEGVLTLPALRFAYFDPDAGRFEEVSTEPLEVRVEGTAPPTLREAAAEAPGEALRDIRAESDLTSHRPARPHRQAWFWLLLGLPALAVAAVEGSHLVARRRRRNAGRNRVKRARSSAEKQLREVDALIRAGEPSDFFAEIARALDDYCQSRLALSLLGATHESIRCHLREAGADDDLADDLVTELENVDYARFAPVSVRADEMRASLERSRTLLQRLDRLPPARRREREGTS